jgi:hypothetical protein
VFGRTLGFAALLSVVAASNCLAEVFENCKVAVHNTPTYELIFDRCVERPPIARLPVGYHFFSGSSGW